MSSTVVQMSEVLSFTVCVCQDPRKVCTWWLADGLPGFLGFTSVPSFTYSSLSVGAEGVYALVSLSLILLIPFPWCSLTCSF